MKISVSVFRCLYSVSLVVLLLNFSATDARAEGPYQPTWESLAEAEVPDGLSFDGVSFLPQLLGNQGNPKPYIYCYYEKGKYDDNGEAVDPDDKPPTEPDEPTKPGRIAKQKLKSQPARWVHDGRWKLLNTGNFFDLDADPDEQSPIPEGTASREGEAKRALFQGVLDQRGTIQKQYGPATRERSAGD